MIWALANATMSCCDGRGFQGPHFIPVFTKIESRPLGAEWTASNYTDSTKYLLNQSLSKLTKEDMHHLSLVFEISPRLADAYKLKNYFMTVLQADSDDALKLLADWLLLAENYNLTEFKPCMTAYRNWSAEILNSLRFPWSMGLLRTATTKPRS